MKRALVISGGGSKGAFAVGVLQGLRSLFPTLNFDILVGTSAGALITPLATLEKINLLEQIFTTITTDQVVKQHRIGDRLNQKSIYTVEPLYELLKKYITDGRWASIATSGKGIYIITTCLQTGGTVVYSNNPTPKPSASYTIKKLVDVEHLRLSVLGSACQPVLMTPVKIDFNYTAGSDKGFQYVDGGVREYAGIQMAIDQGATEVFCILLSTGKGDPVETEYTSLFPILQRSLGIFSEDVQKNDVVIPEQYAKALRYLQAVKQKMKADGLPQAKIDSYFTVDGASNPLESGSIAKIFMMRPDTPLGGGPGGLIFNPVEMRGMVEKGRRAVNTFVARLSPTDKTWV